MKKIFSGLLIFGCFVTIIFLPITVINAYEKINYLVNKTEFQKIKVKIDSIVVLDEMPVKHGGTSGSIYYQLFYNSGNKIDVNDKSKSIYHSKKEASRTNYALKYLKKHNDSLWLWHHPNIKGQLAKENETRLNTNGYVFQSVLNVILIIIAIYSTIWQINKWRKIKKNEKK